MDYPVDKGWKSLLCVIRVEHHQCELTHFARRYMSNRMIHVQLSFREIARALNKFWLVELIFGYKVQRQQIHHTVEQF